MACVASALCHTIINGRAEVAVKSMKRLLQGHINTDGHMAHSRRGTETLIWPAGRVLSPHSPPPPHPPPPYHSHPTPTPIQPTTPIPPTTHPSPTSHPHPRGMSCECPLAAPRPGHTRYARYATDHDPGGCGYQHPWQPRGPCGCDTACSHPAWPSYTW